MEVLEAIFFTVNSVRELAKCVSPFHASSAGARFFDYILTYVSNDRANEDLTEEVTGLSETILAVDSVVQPLLHSKGTIYTRVTRCLLGRTIY
jgi:hypothetical protein